MAPQTAKSLMKEFRASFRRKKVVVDPTPKVNLIKEAEEEELAKLFEMKESLGDRLPPLYTDAALLSFLRARSLNVKEAEKLLQLDEFVKKMFQIDQFEPSESIKMCNFTGVIGFDKEGSLIRIINAGKADVKGIMSTVSTIDIFKSLLVMVEKDSAAMQAENRKTGRKINASVFIINLEGLSMSQVSYKPAFDTIYQALKLLQDHYHDALKTIYFVNAPSFFGSVFKLLKPAIQESLSKRIKILDGNWKEQLLETIDADVLPQLLGGNRVDSNGDPNCSEFISYGCIIPECNYANNFLDLNDSDVVVATVPAGATLNFRYPVRQIGSVLRWHVQAKDNDIGVGLYCEPFLSGTETPRTRKKREEDMSRFEQLTPIIRCQCHICPEEGSAVLWHIGNIILHFDNTYSWMNGKEVHFKVSVRPPTDDEKNRRNSADHAAKFLRKMTIAH